MLKLIIDPKNHLKIYLNLKKSGCCKNLSNIVSDIDMNKEPDESVMLGDPRKRNRKAKLPHEVDHDQVDSNFSEKILG